MSERPSSSCALLEPPGCDDNGAARRGPSPPTDLMVLRLLAAHPWVTPTLCVEQGLYNNKGAAGRRLAFLCAEGYLAVHPERQGHYSAGPLCWEMLFGQLHCAITDLQTTANVAAKVQSNLRAAVHQLEGGCHELASLRMAVDLNLASESQEDPES